MRLAFFTALALSVLLGCPPAAGAGADAEAKAEPKDHTFQICIASNNVGLLVGHTEGDMSWSPEEGLLTISMAPIREVVWKPRDELLEEMPDAKSPLMRTGKLEFALRRVKGQQWRVEAKPWIISRRFCCAHHASPRCTGSRSTRYPSRPC